MMPNRPQKCTELSCQREVPADDENTRCPDCGFPYCPDHIKDHACDGLLLPLELDVLEAWEV